MSNADAILVGDEIATAYPVRFPYDARKLGTYIIGKPGMGKTALLLNLAMNDINSGHGLCVIDPQGAWVEKLLARIPSKREQDVIYFSPAEKDRPIGLHLFECADPDDDDLVDRVMGEITKGIFEELWGDLYEMPRLADVLRVACRTLIRAQSLPDESMRPILIELPLLFQNDDYQRYMVSHLERHYADSERGVLSWWRDFWGKMPDRERQNLTASTLNKIRAFEQSAMVNRVVGQNRSTLDFRHAMDTSKIVLVDLAGGIVGQEVAKLLGSLIISRVYIAAKSRVDLLKANIEPRRFHLLVDEFQNFATYAFAKLQDECRQYSIDITIAHQNRLGQLSGETEVQASTLGMTNWLVFQTIPTDADVLANGFETSPPDPEASGESQQFQFVSFPWASLQHGSTGSSEITNLVYEIEAYLGVGVSWDYGEILTESYSLNPDDYLDAKVWGFQTEQYKVHWVQGLNQVLYLMMIGASGSTIEPNLLGLVETLFSRRYKKTNVSAGWEDATAVQQGHGEVEQPDPPMGGDWGESAERQLSQALQEADWIGDVNKAAPALARLRMRRHALTLIAQLGDMLREQPLRERGGQTEIEYEHPRQFADVANERVNQISRLPQYEALARLQNGRRLVEYHMKTIDAEQEWPEEPDNPTERIKETSRQQYGVPLDQVQEGLRRRAVLPGDIQEDIPPEEEDGDDFPAFGLIDA